MTELPANLLVRWPGRFRFGRLLMHLTDRDEPDLDRVLDTVLDGIIAGRDEQAVLTDLLDNGEFAAAEQMLHQCDVLTDDQIRQARNRLESRRADVLHHLTEHVRQLNDRADDAGLPFEPQQHVLDELSRRSWSQVEAQLSTLESDLTRRFEQHKNDLREQFRMAEPSKPVRDVFTSLLDAGQLRAAAYLMENGSPESPGPETVPQLPAWRWTTDSPTDVLHWHLLPGKPKPPDFADWVAVDETAHQVLDDFDHLSTGGEKAAREFTEVLDRFLDPASASAPATVHRITGGYLTTLRNVFNDEVTARFRPTGTIELFIADPDTTALPDLGSNQFIAVGAALDTGGRLDRTDCAVLTLRDLLRLVTVSRRRSVSLLRVLGRQWPLSAFRAGSPAELEHLFVTDPGSRWQTLSWVTDLSGLGGSAVAEALVYHSAYDSRVLHVLLTELTRAGSALSASKRREILNQWRNNAQSTAAVEAAVLHSVHSTPLAVAAFWIAMGSAHLGERVSLDTMVLTGALYGDWVEREPELRQGLSQLAPHWTVMESSHEHVSLRRCGALIGLRGLAERRISEMAVLLADVAAKAQPDDGKPALTAWQAHRYALSTQWPAYERLDADRRKNRKSVVDERVFDVLENLPEPPEQLLNNAIGLSGTTDVIDVIDIIRTSCAVHHPQIILDVQSPPNAVIQINDRVVRTLLYELVANSVDAMPDGGSIALIVKTSGRDLLIDVLDSGPGLAAEIEDVYRVFRRGVTTRGAGRGLGLFIARRLAQQVEGELELISRPHVHPVLSGAHFRLTLPRT